MNESTQTDHTVTATNAPLTSGKRFAFIIAAIALPVIVLIVLEISLRLLTDLGGYPPLLKHVIDTEKGSLYVVDQQRARSYFFANRDRPGYNSQYSFYLPKPTNTVRILLAGESAIQGYPQSRHLIASSFLKEMLTDVWPGRDVEILNIGTTAVASFPVMDMTQEALAFDPDLVVVYTGHNEFFGAYGVASINRAGAFPSFLAWHRRVHSLALVQALNSLKPSGGEKRDQTLMEIMVGQDQTPADHWTRDAAARQLRRHVETIVSKCRDRGIPVMLCTVPSNERDFVPVGSEPWLAEAPDRDEELVYSFNKAIRLAESEPESAIALLRDVLDRHPQSAKAHYYLGRALFRAGRFDEAREAFIKARDFDTMPWRATSASLAAISQSATNEGAMLCDVQAYFRAVSPGGSVGWELMDDHVHPSLAGQMLLARAIIDGLTRADGILKVDPDSFSKMPNDAAYVARLGDNPFDHYSADHQIRVLFNIPFMRQSNPDGWQRFEQRCRSFEQKLPPDLVEVVKQWQSRRPHAGSMRPLTGMIARALMRRGSYAEAQRLFEIAARAVPPYTSWHMEYLYFDLACREKINGKLTDKELELAGEEIESGKILLSRGFSESGLTERYAGRLHQLRGEYAEAVPYLLASRNKLTGFDLVATDQALFLSYIKTGEREKAVALAKDGAQNSGQYADFYRQLLAEKTE